MRSLISTAIAILTLIISNPIFSQTILNGDFENNTVSTCSYNLSNTDFNSYMQNVIAFGPPGQVDIQTTGCYGNPQNGNWFIGLGAQSSGGHDEVSLELSSPLVMGFQYELTFWAKANNTFTTAFDSIEIGLSATSTNTGSPILVIMPPATAWQQYTVQFYAPTSNISYISMRVKEDFAATSWLYVDNFILAISNTSTSSTINESACDNYISPSGNYVWTNSGTYLDTIPNSFGFDSLMTINLIVNSSTSSNIVETACNSYTSPSGSFIWTTSGTYIDTISNLAGCDSIISIDLTINNSTYSTINETACNSYTSPSGNNIWTASDTYVDTIQNSIGCDSIITVNLTINNNTSSITSITACNSYDFNGTILTADGTYYSTVPNSNGCDSIITLILTINIVDISVTIDDLVLTSNAFGADYQWVVCDFDFAVIAGETNPSFTMVPGASYAVIITENSCVDTSLCYSIEGIDIVGSIANLFSIYPNPTTGNFTIDMDKEYEVATVRIANVIGQVISTKHFYWTDKLAFNINGDKGIYFVSVLTSEGKNMTFKVTKE